MRYMLLIHQDEKVSPCAGGVTWGKLSAAEQQQIFGEYIHPSTRERESGR
jgi:hypothetical protein